MGVWERVTDIEKGPSVGCRVRSRRNGHTCARSELDVLLCDVLRVVGCAAFTIGDTGRSEGTHALGDDQNSAIQVVREVHMVRGACARRG